MDALLSSLGLIEITRGMVSHYHIETKGGFDLGRIVMENGYEVTFLNEYLTLEKDGERIATFPDLIMLLDGETGLPLISAECKEGQKVSLVVVPRDKLLLGKTMGIKKLFLPLEEASGKEIVKYSLTTIGLALFFVIFFLLITVLASFIKGLFV